jgi:diguanylate cyclase
MNIVIVEDSEFIRSQLLRVLAAESRIHVVAIASEEETAVQLILEKQPHAVLLDLSLSPGSGLSVLKRIRAADCSARVLVLTNNVDHALRTTCLGLGAFGFFDKTNEMDQCLSQLEKWLPPLPEHEKARLQEINTVGLLNLGEQEAFDNIAILAREIAATPMSAISLIDEDTQWFLARQGLPPSEASHSVTFCAEAILTPELMVIEDTLEDSKYRDNPLVLGSPQVRFYAGVPLIMPCGESLGTLCVLDIVPRRLSERQKRALKTLGQSAVSEIEVRRRMLKLKQEVGRRRIAEAHIQHLAMRDPLTGLPNRAALNERFEHQLKQAQRMGTQLALLFVDLDTFKAINDTLGHDAGDAALVEVAHRLSHVLRASDTVARLGGDEFVVLLPDVGDEANALRIGQKLVDALHAAAAVRGFPVQLAASVGVALFPAHGDSIGELTHHADVAMYEAKQAGGARVCLFSPEMNARKQALSAIEDDLRLALERSELVVYFQPQVMLAKDVLSGVEALVRWQHPTLGLMPPDQFIPLAERCGLIHLIGRQVLDMALAQLAVLDADGLNVHRIAVNVSAHELRPGFAEMVMAGLKRHQIRPHRLELEITESVLVNDGEGALDVLTQLRARGVSISVDDFGVGYSSLSQLRRLPIDSLKIDRSFVTEICSNAQDRAIVTAIVTMARSLNLRTIAEGAETKEQLAVLNALGCDFVQGYVLARPMPGEALVRWMHAFSASSGG